MASCQYIDSVVLFGDSITQAWSDGSLAQRMSEYYLRRLDVVNRGFGGYNTDNALSAFESVWATRAEREAGCAQPARLITIWFGANDAVVEGGWQHVPLDRFRANLETLVERVRSPHSKWYSPQTRVVLVSCPPVVTADRHAAQMAKWREFGSKGAAPWPDRDPATTKKYAMATVELGKTLGVPVLDVYHGICEAAGSEKQEDLARFLYDGLHLNSEGYAVVFEGLKRLILREWPEMDPESLPMPMPYWADIDKADPEASFKTALAEARAYEGKVGKDERKREEL
ncbi:SGNH hydrolase [Cutaneotrichosporon oleaginosum]|uniref:SGNH hydrolase n=1 Tax=Cutaneotrichosporon oleaginosum TaxID=879819 RepID=A0A0J0XE27_9TREE|nr:SGNH hydrolase [Cutaneotrichosporon oleaginosum]KLT39356.1 SGNH hydrolase [Cutaneotrichosporon oleaginosum]TXT12097.1 hypothetical protein COLE_02507 [Cutaneotrichosporon oleaginosum]